MDRFSILKGLKPAEFKLPNEHSVKIGIPMQLMKRVLQPFREVIVTAMVHSTSLVTVAGGRLRRTVRLVRGSVISATGVIALAGALVSGIMAIRLGYCGIKD